MKWKDVSKNCPLESLVRTALKRQDRSRVGGEGWGGGRGRKRYSTRWKEAWNCKSFFFPTFLLLSSPFLFFLFSLSPPHFSHVRRKSEWVSFRLSMRRFCRVQIKAVRKKDQGMQNGSEEHFYVRKKNVEVDGVGEEEA